VLFFTDFLSTPPGFKAASDAATAKGADDTVVVGVTGPKDTIIDGCTVSAAKASTAVTISKGSQTCVKVGDTAGCTPGRLSLKNSGCSITMPSVTGPCAITYYAASSSTTGPGRGVSCSINGTNTPEAGITELYLNSVQASRKMVYNCTIAGPVVFSLSSVGGGVYLYDIKIEAGTASAISTIGAARRIQTFQKAGTIIKNGKNAGLDIFTLSGEKVMSSNKSVIDVSGLTHGVYMARISGTNEQIKIVR
jgi:hypothetical protein